MKESKMYDEFRVGIDSVVGMYFNLWTGKEIYYVNGAIVDKRYSWRFRCKRRLAVEEGDKNYDVVVEVDTAPSFKSYFIGGEWRMHAYVNGELVESTLFRQYRRKDRILRHCLNGILLLVLMLLAAIVFFGV
jgi:hypothetical protein